MFLDSSGERACASLCVLGVKELMKKWVSLNAFAMSFAIHGGVPRHKLYMLPQGDGNLGWGL